MKKRNFLNVIATSSLGVGLLAILPFGKKNISNLDTKFTNKTNSQENKITVNLNPLAVKRNQKGA